MLHTIGCLPHLGLSFCGYHGCSIGDCGVHVWVVCTFTTPPPPLTRPLNPSAPHPPQVLTFQGRAVCTCAHHAVTCVHSHVHACLLLCLGSALPTLGVSLSDVLERPCTVGGGGEPPPPLDPPPSLLSFQCLRLTAKILLRRLWHQEDLSLNIFGPPSAGPIGTP